MQAVTTVMPGQSGIPGFTPMTVTTGFTFTPGTVGLQSPGFYTPLSPSSLMSGGLVGSGFVTDAAALAGGFRGTGARVPGLLGATTGPRGGLVFSNSLPGPGALTGSAARPSGVPNVAGNTVNTGPGDPASAAPMTYGPIGWPQGWGAVNGMYGGATQIQQQQQDLPADPTAVDAVGSNCMDAVSLQQAAAEVAPSAAHAAAGDGEMQPLALQLQYQQQLRAQMILLGQQQAAAAADAGSVQYTGAMPQAQQQAGQAEAATAVRSLSPTSQQQQQQWLM